MIGPLKYIVRGVSVIEIRQRLLRVIPVRSEKEVELPPPDIDFPVYHDSDHILPRDIYAFRDTVDVELIKSPCLIAVHIIYIVLDEHGKPLLVGD